MNLRADTAAATQSAAGRVCPLDYTYSPKVFARAPEIETTALYVVGGLYGNCAALSEIERMAAREPAPPVIVFNGDQHWFDVDPDWFDEIERGTARHPRLRGNIETEIARPDDVGAGCGCAYPATVGQDTVEYSNEIMTLLRSRIPVAERAKLRDLPMHLVARVGDLRIGIVHGDAAALAGWRFANDALDNPNQRGWLSDIARVSKVDLYASTHTCLPALREFSFDSSRLTVINNGSAGMPNFTGSRFGLISRIATMPSPHAPLYGTTQNGIHIDALPVNYDNAAFVDRFLALWPTGSPAHASYYRRIVTGPDYRLVQGFWPAGP